MFCFVSFCYKATPVIVVEQRTKVNKQRGNNEKNARKSLQFPAPVFGLGGAAEHPVTGPKLPPLGSLRGVVVHGGVSPTAIFVSSYSAQTLWGLCVKVFSNVIVVVLNYVFSKLIIFKKKK